MNILLITEFFPKAPSPIIPGGVQARNFFIAKYLAKKHNLKIINFKHGKIEATSGSLLPRLWFALKVIFARLKIKPDVIEASNTTTFLPAFLLAKRLKVPCVAWIPDILGKAWQEHFSLPVAIAGMFLEKVSLLLSWNQVIAMSQSTKEKLVKAGVKKEKISVVYGGVEYEKLLKLKVKKFSKPTICSIARLLPYKRIKDLIEAISMIKKDHCNIQCLVIGEGPEYKKLQNKIVKSKLTKQVKLLANLSHDKTMETLKRSHVFCLPSITEGFGIVTIEAMAAGVPFVNAKIKPTMEITNNGQGGLLFAAKNPVDLANKVKLLLENKNLYQKKVNQGRKLAMKFNWAIIAQQTEAVYQKVIEN